MEKSGHCHPMCTAFAARKRRRRESHSQRRRAFLQDRRTSTDAGSRITAKVVLCASTGYVYVRQATTFRTATASAFDEKVIQSERSM